MPTQDAMPTPARHLRSYGSTAAALVFIATMCAHLQAVGQPMWPAIPDSVVEGAELLVIPSDSVSLREVLSLSSAQEATLRYLDGELERLDGRLDVAFDRFADALLHDPGGLVGAMSARRLTTLSHVVPALDARGSELLTKLDGLMLPALTSIYVNLLAIQVEHYREAHAGTTVSTPWDPSALGMPVTWRHSGPYSLHSVLHLDRPEDFDADILLQDTYSAYGRPIPTETVRAQLLSLGGSIETGVHVFETWAHLPEGGERLVVLESAQAAVLTIDSEEVLRRHEWGPYAPYIGVRFVGFEPGWHRIRVRLAPRSGYHEIRLRLVPTTVGATEVTFAVVPEGEAALGEIALGSTSESPTALLLPQSVSTLAGPVEALALIHFAADFGEDLLAEHGAQFFGDAPSPIVALALGRALGLNLLLPPSARNNERMHWVRTAVELSPESAGAVMALTTLLRQDGRTQEALELLRPLIDRGFQQIDLFEQLYDLYTDWGWDELAEEMVTEAFALDPSWCGGIALLRSLYNYRDHYPGLDGLPVAFRECRAGLEYEINHVLIPRGDHERALELLEQLSGRFTDDWSLYDQQLDLLMSHGSWEAARAVLDRARANGVDPALVATREADWYLTQGLTDEAVGVLRHQLETGYRADLELLRTLTHIERDVLLPEIREDSFEALAAYEASGLSYEAGAVYALDYGAYRYFEDGSYLMLTHQILHIQSREALATYGEISIPRDAVTLRVRTIKADGTELEPDYIPGKETVSMPNLEVGDYVEYEYVQVGGASQLRGDTILGSRFYFRMFDSPFARSEMVVDIPSSWSELDLDARADAPEVEIETLPSGFRRYRWVALNSVPDVPEDYSPPYNEVLPSVRYSHNYSWEDVIGFYSERIATSVRPHPELDARAAELLAGAEDDGAEDDGAEDERAAVQRIFRYVIDDFRELGGFFAAEAVWTLRLGEGERLPLMLGLLRAAGFEAELVFLRSWATDQTESVVPDVDSYPDTAVRVSLAEEDIWFEVYDYAPFDFLEPGLQEVQGLIVTADGSISRIETPAWPQSTTTTRTEVTLDLDAEGNLRGTILEFVPVAAGGSVRSYLEGVQDMTDIEQVFERSLAGMFPRAELTGLEFLGADEPEGKLGMRYEFVSRGFARVSGDALVVQSRLFETGLRGAYGRLTSRLTPLVISAPTHEELTIELNLPPGFEFVSLPADITLGAPWLEYTWTVETLPGGHGVVMNRSTHMPIVRISPGDYPAFLEVLEAIDRAESIAVRAER